MDNPVATEIALGSIKGVSVSAAIKGDMVALIWQADNAPRFMQSVRTTDADSWALADTLPNHSAAGVEVVEGNTCVYIESSESSEVCEHTVVAVKCNEGYRVKMFDYVDVMPTLQFTDTYRARIMPVWNRIATVNGIELHSCVFHTHTEQGIQARRVNVTCTIPVGHVKKVHEVELIVARDNPGLYAVSPEDVSNYTEVAENVFASFDEAKMCAVIIVKIGDDYFGFDAVIPELKAHLAVDAYWQIPADLKDWLSIMFLMQEKLNDFTFANNGITANDGSVLTSQVFRQETMSARLYPETNKLGPNSNAAEWMRKYWEALHREVIELGEEIPWKWWSKSEVPLNNVREEIVDCWHFLISISIASGLSAGEIVEAYKSKYKKNIERQKTNYVARGDVAA